MLAAIFNRLVATADGLQRREPCEDWKPYVVAALPRPVRSSTAGQGERFRSTAGRFRAFASDTAVVVAGALGGLLIAWAGGNLVGAVATGGPVDPRLAVVPLAIGLMVRAIVAIAPRARAAAYVLIATPALVGLPSTLRAVGALIAPWLECGVARGR